MTTENTWAFLLAGNSGGRILGYYLSPQEEIHAVPLEFVFALKTQAVLDVALARGANGCVQVLRAGEVEFALPLELLLHILHAPAPPVRGALSGAESDPDATSVKALPSENRFENESENRPAPPALPAPPVEGKGDQP